ncbi:arsenate reductase family protein [Helicobacter cholecystus]|uniref:Arsenate reductase family protein n=1 Tax=Helicobacter cholecystus TaxID=45498 RepID=A0A3D8IW87_9HELI|nr:arsenate reductase family protein [Helicobacter cholecystus]RDU69549.1 arsenate reductase family protein [Helicobacter cholecystus]VEJ24104.1 arsenate reductase [Helicobacter cholecystus]
MIVVSGIRNCQSVKKALVFLDSRHVDYDFVDYKKNPPSISMLKEWVRLKGIDKVLNKRGTTYRSLGLANQNLSEDELLEQMSKNPTLIKRPILVGEDILEFGFTKEGYEKFF